jgi:hypothetical protein
VEGGRVSKADLCDFLHARFREQWFLGLDLLLDERLAALEAARHGFSVPPAALETAVEAEVAARRAQASRQGTDLAATVRAAYGLDVEAWRRDVLSPRVRARLLVERAARRSSRSREQVVCRVIVLPDRAGAGRVAAALARGADFGLLALQESTDGSRAAGGLLPPIARGDLLRADLEALLFGAAPGSVVGPVDLDGPRGGEVHLYKVVERRAAWGAQGARLVAMLEDDLARAPVSRSELERWASRARREHAVVVFAPDGSRLRLPE